MTRHLLPTALLVLLALQAPEPLPLDQEYQRLIGGSNKWMVTFVARHRDGTPARGSIACEGYWYKFQDASQEQFFSWAYPFATDSRGAVIFNPNEGPEYWDCTAVDEHLHSGGFRGNAYDREVIHLEVE